jgi:hypothetical protein
LMRALPGFQKAQVAGRVRSPIVLCGAVAVRRGGLTTVIAPR